MVTFLLFLHLCGVALLFIMISMELVALCCAPRAVTVAGLRAATFATPAIEKIAPVATLGIVGSGLWLVGIDDYIDFGAAWIVTAIVVSVFLALSGTAVQGRRLTALRAAAFAAPDGPIPVAVARLAGDRVMHLAGWASCGAGIGFLYLMVERPAAAGSILIFIVAPLLGAALGLLLLARAEPAAG